MGDTSGFHRVTRRDFVRLCTLALGATATSLAAACASAPAPAPTQPPAKPAAEPTKPAPIQPQVGGSGAATAAPAATTAAAPASTQPAAAAKPAAGTPKKGGRLIFGDQTDWVDLTPLGGAGANELAKEHFYDSLVEFDKNFKIVPALAESWEMPDDLTYTFKLRKDVKFHNGKQFTAKDVVYSMGLHKNKDIGGAYTWYTFVDKVVPVDDFTVQFKMNKLDLALPGTFSMHRFAGMVPEGAWEKQDLKVTALGTGPYQLVEYVPTDHITMKRFPDHFRKDVGLVDEIILKLMPDEDARIAALRSGAVDLAYVSPDGAARVAKEQNLQVFEGYVCAPRIVQLRVMGEKKPMDDQRVRRALALATDHKEIIEKVYIGKAMLSGFIPSLYGDWSIPQEELESKWVKYDLNEAKKLMAEAGFPNGGFTLNAVTFPASEAPKRMEIIKEQWKKIGVDVNIQLTETGVAVKKLGEADFDLFPTGRGMRNDPDGFVTDLSYIRDPEGKRQGLQGWRPQALAELIEKAKVTKDPAQRHQMYLDIQRQLLTETPHVYGILNMEFVGAQKYVKDYYVSFGTFRPALRTAWVDK